MTDFLDDFLVSASVSGPAFATRITLRNGKDTVVSIDPNRLKAYRPDQPERRYRPDIDGLRAIAVLSVLFYHFELPILNVPGGYSGVDVFFVISGYLITRILVAQAGQAGALQDFYLRRFRRIFPALLAVIAFCLASGYFLLMPGDYADVGESARYALFALSNLFFYANTGYFDQAAEFQLLLHTWSLAVEEQFYLVWPLVVLMTFREGRRTYFIVACSVIVVASFVYAVLLVGSESKAAFYNPLARAWELALGGLLVFMPVVRVRPFLSEVVNVLGLGLIGYGFFGLDHNSSFPGANALYACIGSALLIWPKGNSSVVARCMGNRLFRGVGLISYSLYLWHWPVLVIGRHYFVGSIPVTAGFGLVAGVVLLAWLSWRFIEQPFRRSSFLANTRSPIAVMCVMLLTIAATAVFVTDGAKYRLPDHVLPMASLHAMWQWHPEQEQLSPFVDQMVFGAPWKEAEHKVILWGDSHAEHMAPLLEAAMVQGTRHNSVSILLYRSCPANVDGRGVYVHIKNEQYNRDCHAGRTRMFRFLAEQGGKVDVVVLASSWTPLVDSLTPDGNQASGLLKLEVSLTNTVDKLLESIPRVTLIGEVPMWPHNPVPCVNARATGLSHQGCDEGVSELKFDELSSTFVLVDQLLRNLAQADSRITALVPSESLCNERSCESVIDGHFLYRDRAHLRRNLPRAVRFKMASRLGLDRILSSPDRFLAQRAPR